MSTLTVVAESWAGASVLTRWIIREDRVDLVDQVTLGPTRDVLDEVGLGGFAALDLSEHADRLYHALGRASFVYTIVYTILVDMSNF
jgi:hypothetical protein